MVNSLKRGLERRVLPLFPPVKAVAFFVFSFYGCVKVAAHQILGIKHFRVRPSALPGPFLHVVNDAILLSANAPRQALSVRVIPAVSACEAKWFC
jgi:hypothetical protein